MGGTLATVNGTSDWYFNDAVLAVEPAPLPVELRRFDAQLDDGEVHLSWTTATEASNVEFRVQRKADIEKSKGENRALGSEEWRTLGRIDGAGTTSRVHTYQFTDEALPFDADALTYRLLQVDANGAAHDVRTITVPRGVNEVQLLGPAPNPARRQATIRYALPRAQDVTLALCDVLGRQVRTIVRREMAAGRYEQPVGLGELSSGLYVLRLRVGETLRTQKLTVVR